MAPFEENGMFSDGSRWDWYVIGGRWDGLIVPGNKIQVKDLKKIKFDHKVPAHYAFLRNRRWNEAQRMGWFGRTIPSECKLAGKDETKRCLYRHPKMKASVTVWNETDEEWNKSFYDRFVKPLPPETWLVTVDFHV